jgi:hypothetical protein
MNFDFICLDKYKKLKGIIFIYFSHNNKFYLENLKIKKWNQDLTCFPPPVRDQPYWKIKLFRKKLLLNFNFKNIMMRAK